MPRSNGSTGSTTAACWSRSATCHRPKPKRPTTGNWRSPPQSPPESTETASEEVGTVQYHYLPFPRERTDFLFAAACVDGEQCHLSQMDWKVTEEPLLLIPVEWIRRSLLPVSGSSLILGAAESHVSPRSSIHSEASRFK